MTELLYKEIYDSTGNVLPEVADKPELAGEIYALALEYAKDDCTLKWQSV